MWIDRVNNDLGYILENCVSCCTNCNYFKCTYKVSDFIRYCTNTYNNFGTIEYHEKEEKCKIADVNNQNDDVNNVEYDDEELPYWDYYSYISWTEKRDKAFRITKDEFNDILSKKCYYCANTNMSNIVEIDCVDTCSLYI